MPYTPPTLGQMIESISVDLRDFNNQTFSTSAISDLIDWGLVEVDRVYPLMGTYNQTITEDENGEYNTVIALDPTSITEISRVEVWRDGRFRSLIPPMGDGPNSGWDHFGGELILPTWLHLSSTEDVLKVYGYSSREQVTDENEALEVDAEAERAVRLFAVSRGYQRLQSDRALFTQWLSLPGNTDVSPTQLDGMSNTYMADWERYRKHIRRLRR